MFEKYILRKAKEIEEKKQKKQAIVLNNQIFRNNKSIEVERRIKDILYEFNHKVIVNFVKTPCHLKEGDIAVINPYQLLYKNSNSWDTGVNFLLSNMSDEEKSKLPKVKITKVNASSAYFSELVDNFIEKIDSISECEKLIATDTVVSKFKEFCDKKNILWKESYGIYYNVKFTPITFEFSPKYGLNSGSFLLEDSDAGKLTKELWDKEHKLLKKYLKAKSKYKTYQFVSKNKIASFKEQTILEKK